MIDRREILEAASSFSLLPNIVEKDYVLGWILAGIYAHEELAETWIFKGGTCLKKCYFETYRFSEDLDFTLNEEHLDEEFLQTLFEEVVTWVTDQSGLNMGTRYAKQLIENIEWRKEWAEKVGLGFKLPSPPLGIGQLGQLSEAKTQSAKAA